MHLQQQKILPVPPIRRVLAAPPTKRQNGVSSDENQTIIHPSVRDRHLCTTTTKTESVRSCLLTLTCATDKHVSSNAVFIFALARGAKKTMHLQIKPSRDIIQGNADFSLSIPRHNSRNKQFPPGAAPPVHGRASSPISTSRPVAPLC